MLVLENALQDHSLATLSFISNLSNLGVGAGF
jgi:hypothetical protein